MKIVFIGDIVGSLGRDMVFRYLPRLKRKYSPDVVIANGENAAAGRGITKSIFDDLLRAGVRRRHDGQPYVGSERNL